MRSMVNIYTDGGCKRHSGIGGWAALILEREANEISGGERETTSNRMKLTAAIVALISLGYRPHRVRLHSGSRYVVNGTNGGVAPWRRSQQEDRI